jgi:hypothetical protein
VGDIGFASNVKFRLTSHWPPAFFVRITEDQLQFTTNMKKLLTLTMLISFAMICSCQKQDSAAERQLAQRKAELDAREKALDEREKALAERENAKVQGVPAAQSRRQVRDPAQSKAERNSRLEQLKAERDSRLEQLPPDARQLILEPSGEKAARGEKDAAVQERLAQQERMLEEKRRMRTSGMDEKKSRAAELSSQPASLAVDAAKAGALSAYPQPEAASAPQMAPLSVYPQPEATSPPSLAASPGAEATSPSPSPTPQ